MSQKSSSSDPHIADIREEWHWVQPLLVSILKSNKYLTWIPEDVYHECRKGDAVLWVADQGFAITTIAIDEYSSERSFVIWIAAAKSMGGRNVVTYLPFFEDVAKGCDCTSVEVWSFVGRMEEYLAPLEFEVATRVFKKRVLP